MDRAPGLENPAGDTVDGLLDDDESRHSAGLMRVNHAGEVAAQALYQGQSLTGSVECSPRDATVRAAMETAAREENDHLVWCRQRLAELGSGPSLLDPFWFGGSLAIGIGHKCRMDSAGLAGDRWSLGFVAETERQVVDHLEDHLGRLPEGDRRSRAVLERMQVTPDARNVRPPPRRTRSADHATRARAAGGAELPPIVQRAMRAASRVMTRTAYRV